MRINYECASLVVEYEVAYQKFLERMLRELKRTPLADIRARLALVEPESRAASISPETSGAKVPPSKSWQGPLALPTVSLALLSAPIRSCWRSICR